MYTYAQPFELAYIELMRTRAYVLMYTNDSNNNCYKLEPCTQHNICTKLSNK